MIKKTNKQSGYVAFTTLLIISSVALGISVSISLLGIVEASTALTYKKGQETFHATKGCLHETLLRLHDDARYTGSSPTIGNTTCTISVSGTNPTFTATVSAQLNGPPDYTQTIQATVRRAGNHVDLLTWQQLE